MKFYKVNYSNDKKVIGNITKPIKNVLHSFNFPDEAYYSIHHGDYFDDKSAIFPDLILNHRAKWTDFTYHFMNLKFKLFSEKSWDIISRYKLPNITCLPLRIHKGNKSRPYVAIHFNSNEDDNFFLWSDSSFYLINKITKIKTMMSFNNSNEYYRYRWEALDDAHYLIPKHLQINPDFAYDIFYIGLIRLGLYCSEKLKNAILDENLVGFDFLEIKDFDVVV